MELIDLHCHILPNVDDGARSLEESLEMARHAVKDGIHTVVATPHTLDGVYSNPSDRVTKEVAALQDVLLQNHIELKLYPGSDVHLCPGMSERIRNGEACTINGTGKFIMLELPSSTVPAGVKDEIFALKMNGITPIISHPERNSTIQQDTNIMYELIYMGALGQVTAMSLTGAFGKLAETTAGALLRHRMVHIIASDAHSAQDRPPILSEAVQKAAEILKDYDEAERMVTSVPSAILAGAGPDLPEPSRIKHRGRFF
jgi:protein-tyrosine phosphatase